MEESPYVANYNFALSYLKSNQKDAAVEALESALAQVPENEKNENNSIYLSIISALAFLVLEKNDFKRVARYVEEGLAVKKDYADLLFMKALLLMDMKRFDEMLETLIHYLLALAAVDREKYDYKYTGEGALKEVYVSLLPVACKNAFEFEKIRDISEQLSKSTGSEWLKKACEVMAKVAEVRSVKEN